MKRLVPRLFLLCVFFLSLAREGRAQVMISEFLAENAASLTDEDGDHSDWIELLNTTSQPVNLEGWALSDDPQAPGKWRFPALTIPGRGYAIIFASGKNRAVSGAPLHTNFGLSSGGDSLLLVRPDGSVASSFLNFPAQREDVAFGVAREVLPGTLVTQGSAVRALIPANGDLGSSWTGGNEPFSDEGWISGVAGAGYDQAPPTAGGLVASWDFNDASNAAVALDSSGNARHGTVENGAAFTADAAGRTGAAGDRAMNFGNVGSARVRIGSAATGALDALTTANAVTISVWTYGDASQPAEDSLFYAGSTADGGGERALNAHAPWSDSVVYWDTRGTDGSTRISVSVPDPTKWKGRWNHYAFVKNGATKRIWLNGTMIAAGQNPTVLGLIRSFWIGFAPWGTYGGKMDDFAVWNRALGSEEIGQLAQGASPLSLLGFGNIIGTDLGAMRGVNATAYLREAFPLPAAPDYDSLELRVKYDDGFAAFLNGTEITRRNAPEVLAWNSAALADRSRVNALSFEAIELPGGAALLQAGTNILASQALNHSTASDELLLLPELAKVRTTPARYLTAPTPSAPNGAGVLGFVAVPTISVPRGYYSSAFNTTLASATPGATLVYTLDGSKPSLTNGIQIAPPDANTPPSTTISINRTSYVRVAAVKEALQASKVKTATYLFAAQIATQPASIPGWPATWNGGFPGDYQMDPDVVNSTLPNYGISEALASLPSVSIVGKLSDLVNVYNNPGTRDLEAAVSAEWIDPAKPAESWQEDCGIVVHGNISREKSFTPKHGFRLNFSAAYGARSLKQDLFPTTNVDKFDQIVLKSMSTDTWPVVEWTQSVVDTDLRWQRAEAAYICDQFMRDSQLALGRLSAHGRFAHLFLNGVYWGLINVMERPVADFCAEHLGGEPEEWDVMKDYNELEAGSRAPWDQLLALAGSNGFANEATYQRAQGNNPDGSRNPAFPVLMDVPNLIDYMILHIASGADDWPEHNWIAGRRRTTGDMGFQFFAWDQEISNNSVQKQHTATGQWYELVNSGGSPAQLYNSGRSNPGFRRQFADRVQQLFFNNGPLTQAASVARWNGLKAVVDKALVAESARWGDYQRPAQPYKREVEWLTHMNWMNSTYWPQFVSRALTRFRTAGLFPNTAAPIFSQHGGAVSPGFALTITNPGSGTIYYTTNGTDPAAAGAPVYSEPIPISSLVTVRARVKNGTEWSALTEAVFQPQQNFAALSATEICFDPPGAPGIAGEEREFIELQNTGATSLDLSSVSFTAGIGFTFPEGTSLAPGAFVVIARNPAQFAAHFGGSALGPYSGQLDNKGETITLTSALGATIFSFAYGAGAGWAPTNGGSLHFTGAGLPGSPGAWFAFRASPGAHPEDADSDGESNFAEGIAGTDAGNANSALRITAISARNGGGYIGTFTAVADRTYTVLVSSDLVSWTRLPPDLTASVTGPLEFVDATPGGERRFYKVITPAQP